MKFDVLDKSGKKVSDVELSDAVFGITNRLTLKVVNDL